MKSRLLPFSLLLIVFGMIGISAQAATLFVTSSGNNSRTYAQAQSRDSSLLTIAQAITLASDGDVIIVGPGTFAGFTMNKRLTVIGAGSDGSSTTIINTGISLSAAVSGSLRCELRGLRVTPGSAVGVTISTSNISLVNTYIIGGTNTGILVSGNADDIAIANCAINGNARGFVINNDVNVDGFVMRNTQVRGNTAEAFRIDQTTNPSTVDFTNVTITNCSFDANQTASGGNLQVWQIAKLSNATISNCVFHRAGTNTTNASNLVNLALFGKAYSNITFRHCRFYSTVAEATSNLRKRGIYAQPNATNASLSNLTVEGCEFGTSYVASAMNSPILFQNALSGTLRARYNAMPQTQRSNMGVQVFGTAAAGPYSGGVDLQYNYFNALGAGKHGSIRYGLASSTNGSASIATGVGSIIAANNPLVGESGLFTPTTPYAGFGGLFGISAYNSGTGIITASSNAASTTSGSVSVFNSTTLETASFGVLLTQWGTSADISNFQTTTLTSGYTSPVFRLNSSQVFQASYGDLATAVAAASNGDILQGINARTMSGGDATITIPTGANLTFVTPGHGRYNSMSATTYSNISIPATSTLTLGSDMLVSGTLTINGTLNLNGYNLVMSGNSSVFAGSGTITDGTGYGQIVLRGSARAFGTISLGGSANLAGIVDSSAGGSSITINGTGSLSSNGYSRVLGTMNVGGSLTFNGHLIQGAPSFGGTGNLTIAGSYPVALGAYSLNNLTVNTTSMGYMTGNLTVGGTTTLTAGELKVFANTLTLGGAVSGSGDIVTTPFSNLTLNGSGTANLPNTINWLNNLTINRSASDVVLGGNLTTYGTIAMTDGYLSLNGYRLNLNHASTFSGAGALIKGNQSSTIYVHGPTAGGITSAGTLNFDAAPNNKVATIWSLRSLTLGSDVEIHTRLRLRRGTFAAGGNNVLFVSTASYTAKLDTIDASAAVTGFTNVTAQRHYGSTARWMLVGTPIAGKTLSDWQETSLGTNGINFTFNTGGGQQPSVWTFTNGGNWVAGSAATLSQTFAPGRGLRIYARTPFLTLNNGPAGLFGAPAGPGRMYWNGTPSTGAFTFTGLVGTGNGWNLVSNPYIAPLDWEAESNWTRTNVTNTLMYWDVNQYKGLIKVGPTYVQYNGGSGIIPSGQGFFVQATGTPTFAVAENAKAGATNSFYRNGQSANVMRVVFSNNANTNSDEVLYAFDNNAGYSANYVRGEDVSKLSGTSHSISSYSADDVALTADLRPVVNGRDSIKLAVSASSSGAYNLEFRNLPANVNFMLKDRKLGTLTTISNGMNYAFNILTTDTTTFGRNRFELVMFGNVTSLNPTSTRSLVIYPNPSNGNDLHLAVNGFSAGERLEISAVDALGRQVVQGQVIVAAGSEHMAAPFKLTSGVYSIVIKTSTGVITQKVVVQ